MAAKPGKKSGTNASPEELFLQAQNELELGDPVNALKHLSQVSCTWTEYEAIKRSCMSAYLAGRWGGGTGQVHLVHYHYTLPLPPLLHSFFPHFLAFSAGLCPGQR